MPALPCRSRSTTRFPRRCWCATAPWPKWHGSSRAWDGAGFGYAMEGLDAGRLGIAVQAVGIARRALEHAVAYCDERKQFDQPLRAFEAVQFKLADMATRVEAARALAHVAGARRDRGESVTTSASMAKLFASEIGR